MRCFLDPSISASLELTGQFEAEEFSNVIKTISERCARNRVACGLHVVMPDVSLLRQRLGEGYLFIAYSIDAVFLRKSATNPQAASGMVSA